MIAKGNFHAHGSEKLAAYLVTGQPGEKAELFEMRGFRANDLREAFRDIEIEARGTRAETAFFHCYTRLSPGEKLTDEQWRQLADREEKRLGFTGQPRAISFHVKADGEKHMHIAWSRIARTEDGLHAIDPGLYKDKLKEICREYEVKFALREVSSERAADQKTRAVERNEFEESRRLDTDLKATRNAIHDCLQHSDNGNALTAALAAQGFVLSKGDRRDCFVVIDQAGGHHALNKRLTGMTLAETRGRLSDLDAAKLPTVDQAKEMQRQQRAAVEARQAQGRPAAAKLPQQANGTAARAPAPAQPPPKPLGKTAGEIRIAWQTTRTGEQFAESIKDRGLHLVYVTADQARSSERTHDFARAIGRQSRPLRAGFGVVDQRGNVTRIEQRATGDQWEEIQKRLGGIERDKLLSLATARADMAEKNQAEFEARRAAGRAEFIARKDAERIERRLNGPVGKAAGEIRLAWQLSRATGDPQRDIAQLHEALDMRGWKLARVTAEEAYASERTAALAKAAGNYAPVYGEGEIVAVNRFGNATRFDERTTGKLRPEIDARLAGIDAGSLLSIDATKTAINEARREAWIAEQERKRPASWIESRIADCAGQADLSGAEVVRDRETGRIMWGADALDDRLMSEKERRGVIERVDGAQAFAARLADAGIAIVRVTAEDVPALEALRRDEQHARTAAHTNNETRRQQHFAKIEQDELAAVTRNGDVYRINLEKTGDAKRHLAEPFPHVIAARAAWQADREATATLYRRHSADKADERQARADVREQRAAEIDDRRARREINTGMNAAGDIAARGVGRIFRPMQMAGALLAGIFSILAGGPVKLTAQQMKDQARGDEQRKDDAFKINSAAEQEARFREYQEQMARESGEHRRQRREQGIDGDLDRDRDL